MSFNQNFLTKFNELKISGKDISTETEMPPNTSLFVNIVLLAPPPAPLLLQELLTAPISMSQLQFLCSG